MKYVCVSGGVISGVGKGIIASSTGLLLKTMGLRVTMIKIDPYLNVDAGTMAPTEHGEVFVLDDGGEVDLDLGNYERYLNLTLHRKNNITTGKIYQHVIERERKGFYLGKTVQLVPHLTDAIQDWIEQVAKTPVDATNGEPDVCVIELGGTVGDIESAPFIEALRQLRRRAGRGNFLHIHVSLIPVINGEQKSKPTQMAMKDVGRAGLTPDLIACRCQEALSPATIEKVSVIGQVEPEQIVAVPDVDSTYHVPLVLEKQGLLSSLSTILQLSTIEIPRPLQQRGAFVWKAWKTLTASHNHLYEPVTIALVGKYTSSQESYTSVIKSLEHSAMACQRKLKLVMIDSSHLEQPTSSSSPSDYHKAWGTLCEADGILVPGGFGNRGTEGMIIAAKWAREKNVPYLGVCLGMQMAVVEYARNVCGITNAASEEFDSKTPNPLIVFMPEIDRETMGGTMRLGNRPTHFQPGSNWSRVRKLYENSQAADSSPPSTTPATPGSELVSHGDVATFSTPTRTSVNARDELIINERHRHRYEVNPKYVDKLLEHGLNFIGKDDTGERMEILELRDHPWFVGVQFHPEYLSKVLEPSRPFLGFLAASAGCLDQVTAKLIANTERRRAGKEGSAAVTAKNSAGDGPFMLNGQVATEDDAEMNGLNGGMGELIV